MTTTRDEGHDRTGRGGGDVGGGASTTHQAMWNVPCMPFTPVQMTQVGQMFFLFFVIS